MTATRDGAPGGKTAGSTWIEFGVPGSPGPATLQQSQQATGSMFAEDADQEPANRRPGLREVGPRSSEPRHVR